MHSLQQGGNGLHFEWKRVTSDTKGRHPKDHMSRNENSDDDGDHQSHTYSKDWLVDDLYYRSHSKSKAGVVFLKLDSGEA